MASAGLQQQRRQKPEGQLAAEAGAAAAALTAPAWPEVWPYTEHHLARHDESDDGSFYSQPRLVTHIDDAAIESLRSFYTAEPAFASPAKAALLDVASSWISHYPPAFKGSGGGRVAGLGMNEYELAQNPQLTEYAVKDLNQDPKLPYEDDAFDAVTIAVSIDYMAQPLQLLQEIHRVLREGGTAYMSFSNRCFPTKVVKMWLDTNDSGRIWIVGSYVHFAGGFSSPAVLDISTHPGRTDPMYVVSATKLPAAGNPDAGEL